MLFLTNLYLVYRIYNQKKYLTTFWIREYGPSLLDGANNGEIAQENKALNKEKDRSGKYLTNN